MDSLYYPTRMMEWIQFILPYPHDGMDTVYITLPARWNGYSLSYPTRMTEWIRSG